MMTQIANVDVAINEFNDTRDIFPLMQNREPIMIEIASVSDGINTEYTIQ